MEAAEAETQVTEAFAAGSVDSEVCGPEHDVVAFLRGEMILVPPKARIRLAGAPQPPEVRRPSTKEKARAKRKREEQARRKTSSRKRKH